MAAYDDDDRQIQREEEEEEVKWGQTERPDDVASEESGEDEDSADVASERIDAKEPYAIHKAVWSGQKDVLMALLGVCVCVYVCMC